MASTVPIKKPPIPVQSNPDQSMAAPANNENDQSTTTTPEVSVTTAKRKISKAWVHFDKRTELNPPKAECKHCHKKFAFGSKSHGTTNLINHINKRLCSSYNPPGQKCLTFQVGDDGETHSIMSHSFDQESCRAALTRMIIKDELPFAFVQREGFLEFCRALQPRFQAPSRFTEARDCMKLYLAEYNKLKTGFQKQGQRLCLTTDTWTSIQNLSYMCLTGHYIDENWVLKKKILNFCPVAHHSGVELGKTIAACLIQWGIEKVFTVTVDNASANTETIIYLSKRVVGWKAAILGGTHMHVRCAAHILALVVKDGMDLYNESISRIRAAVKFVRASPARLKNFKACAEERKIDYSKFLTLDLDTRWNSTYTMLVAAERYEEAFYQFEESGYAHEFLNPPKSAKGPRTTPSVSANDKVWPNFSDWTTSRLFVLFLETFYEATLRFSGTLYVTSNLFLDEVVSINEQLQAWVKSDDVLLADMADWMVLKYEKYWEVEKINKLLYISVLLDPRRKEAYLVFCLKELVGGDGEANDTRVDKMMKSIKCVLTDMFNEYAQLYKGKGIDTISAPTEETESVTSSSRLRPQKKLASRFMQALKQQESVEGKTELDIYLSDKREDVENEDFDILSWWKINSCKYKVLSTIARDVLAMPVSTVASESAFSTGGRVLDKYRSSMQPKTVQALICTQNWLQEKPTIDLEELIEGVEKIDSDALEVLKDIPEVSILD